MTLSQFKKEHPSLFYKVESLPLSKFLPKDFITTSGNSHGVFTTLPNGKVKLLQTCSEGYEVVTNEEFYLPLFQTISEQFGEVELKTKIHDDRRFYVDFTLKDSKFEYQLKQGAKSKPDILYPRIQIVNSYDGGAKLSYNIGIFRLICSNGMVVPAEGTKHISGKFLHTGQLSDGEATRKLGMAVESFMDCYESQQQVIQELSSYKLKVGETQEFMEDVVKISNFPKRQVEAAMQRLNEEVEIMKAPRSKWLVYNALNYQLNHADVKMMPHKREKLDRQLMDVIKGYQV